MTGSGGTVPIVPIDYHYVESTDFVNSRSPAEGSDGIALTSLYTQPEKEMAVQSKNIKNILTY